MFVLEIRRVLREREKEREIKERERESERKKALLMTKKVLIATFGEELDVVVVVVVVAVKTSLAKEKLHFKFSLNHHFSLMEASAFGPSFLRSTSIF